MSSYIPLWCKSNFSFLEGASHPEELVKQAQELGLRGVALTDRDGVHGIVRAHVKAKELGLPLIVGAEVTITDGTAKDGSPVDPSPLILLVQDRGGYANLCRLLTTGRLRSPKGQSRVTWEEVCRHAPGLLALWGGDRSLLMREAQPPSAEVLREAFGDRLYALVTRHRRAGEARQEAALRAHAKRLGLPLAAAVEVLYHAPQRRPLQDVLTCVRHGVTIDRGSRFTKPNALHALPRPADFAALFEDLPAAVARTEEIAARCTFSMGEIRYRYPTERLPDGTTTAEWLQDLTHLGGQARYPQGIPPKVAAQLCKELALIEKLDFCGYFLTLWEIVRFCREQGILCQGRGSAANSAVCYCLGITAVDPVKIDLLFERFLSEERAEPPDIDLDIQHSRREEVIQHVYEKYGRTHAAMVANVIRYQPRSAIRDVGKALGLPQTLLDRLSKLISHHAQLSREVLQQAGIDPDNLRHRHLLQLTAEILGFPRHLSIHPGGFLLGHEPVHDLVPIEKAAMADRTVIQWDKDDVEAMGLFKVDLLGLGALTHLDLGFKLLQRHRNLEFSLATIPKEDPATYAMMCRADTVGVFQIESRAQMAMLPRLKPKEFYDLVIEISIVRPGPITGGMVHPYLRRRNREEPVDYPHDSLTPVLEKTLGIPLFQEQVMRLAVIAADYTPGEADQLRRDMAAWRRSGSIEKHHERLVMRMQAKGISSEFAERVFSQIRGFGEYGFPESHAASFALIAYATAWLKCHYPAEFTCALLNAWPMGFYSPATLVEDAKRHQVQMLPIDVQRSEWFCTLEPCGAEAFAVRMGLRYVKGLGEADGLRIEAERCRDGFQSLANFRERTTLTVRTLEKLAEAGALDGFGLKRREALWAVRGEAPVRGLSLPDTESLPAFVPLDRAQAVDWDYRSSLHSVRGHPLAGFRAELRAVGFPEASSVNRLPNGRHVRYVGAVINRQRPGTAKGVVFMTLEDETGFVNLVIWEKIFEQYPALARTALLLGVTGKVQAQDGVIHLVAEQLWQPILTGKPFLLKSRDFH